MKYPIAAATAVAFGIVTSASAADIEEITVFTSPLGDSLQPAQVIDAQELLLRRAPTIGETLDAELGINSSYFGPASSRPIIRGQAGSRVKVLTDAVSTLDVADVSADHAVTVEPVLADRIEIIRGPYTLLYGSQAAGGVVNVQDGRVPRALPEDLLDGAVELRGDTASSEEALVGRLDAGLGPVALHLDGFTRETDDLEIPGFATTDPAERPDDEPKGTLRNSASETDSFAGGLSLVFDSGFVGVAASRLESTYGLPGPEEEEGGEEEPALFPGPFIDLEQTRVDLRGEYTGEGLVEKLKLSFGINDYEHAEIEPSGEPATLFENDAWQGRVELVHRELIGLRGVVGLQVDDRDFSAVGEEAFVEPVKTESWGLFIVEQLGFDWGRIELGLRADPLEHKPTAPLSDYDETAVSAAAGLVFEFAEAVELYGNIARTERHPAAEELYSDGAHLATGQFEIGLLADRPEASGSADKETSVNLDVGIRRVSGVWQFEAGIFYNDADKFIFQDLTGDIEDDLPVAIYRQADAEFWGLEAEVRLQPDGLPLNPRFRIFTDFVEAELSNGSKLPRISPLRFGGSAGIGSDVWGIDLDLVYHDKQDDVSSFQTDSYTMLNLGGWYRLELDAVAVELFARGTNLLDEEARKSTSFLAAFAPLPGASLHAGARLRF